MNWERDGDSQRPINKLNTSAGSLLGRGPGTAILGQGVFVGGRLRFPTPDPQRAKPGPRASVSTWGKEMAKSWRQEPVP